MLLVNGQAASKQQVAAYMAMCEAVADAIRGLGTVPAGHLYARVIDRMTLDMFTSVIGTLVRAGAVIEQGHLLRWNLKDPTIKEGGEGA